MTVISSISFFILIIVALSTVGKGTDSLSPSRVFIAIWSLAIGLADLKLSGFQAEWSLESWIVLLLGVSSLLVGCFAPYILNLHVPLLRMDQIRQRFREVEVNLDVLFGVIVTMWVLYSVSLVIETKLAGGFPAFARFPDRARVSFGVFGLHLMVDFMPAILFLCVEYFVFSRSRGPRHLAVLFIFLTTALSFLALLQRFSFVAWALTELCFLFYASSFVRPRNLLISGSVFGAAFAYVISLRLTRYVENYLYVISRMRFSVRYAFFTEPYMYIVMNLENFARGVHKLERFTFGYYTMDFLMALTGLKHWLADYFGLVERPFLMSGYNTFSFLWPYYYDFGAVGVAVIPFVLGFFIASVYYQLRRKPTLMSLILYANAFSFLVLSFFTNIFTALGTVTNIGLLAVIHLVFVKSDWRSPETVRSV